MPTKRTFFEPNARFGKLTVRSELRLTGPRHWFALCDCDCGATKLVRVDHLKRGTAKSCGQHAYRSARSQPARTANPQYSTWANMRARCSNQNSTSYRNYGARGITVCERWDNFENFFADMGARPSEKHSIDRINNDGNYEPGNCRWATASEQALNRRRRAA